MGHNLSVHSWKWHNSGERDKPTTFQHNDQRHLFKGTSRYMKVVHCLLMMRPSGKEERTWIMTSGKCKEQLMKWWSVFYQKKNRGRDELGGVIFDARLTWADHMRKVEEKWKKVFTGF